MSSAERRQSDRVPGGPPGVPPQLARLQLTATELEALTRQGFVSEEHRRTLRFYKLRFRVGGKQKVRYLGNDESLVDEVRRELAALQARRRAELRLRQLQREARRELRRAKSRIEPWLEPVGYAFHGHELRRRESRDCPRAVDQQDERVNQEQK